MPLPREPDRLSLPVSGRDHCQGNPAATITLVQYGDYQCPNCSVARYPLQFIQQQLGDQIRLVFRHFPQPAIHANAYHAAEAVEAAASQHKFWDMHNYLLEHQSQLDDSNLVQYAIALYLDVDWFLREMAMDCHVARIQADIDSGLQSGVIKTPTFFINDVKCRDDRSLEDLLEDIIQVNRGSAPP
jgi:protein-disulfide isomerase